MTVTDKMKILERKAKQDEAQYDLGREVAKISALSSGNLDKYEYLIGDDLNYKPSTVEKAKFDYSPLSKFFNKRLKEEHKKEGLLKRLKNIEDKNEEQLKIIGKKTNIKSQIDLFDEDLTLEAIALIKEIKSIENNVDYSELSFTGGNKKVYDLDSFKTLEKSINGILSKNMTKDKAEIKQNKYAEKLDELRAYPVRRSKYISLKESVSKNVKHFHDEWEKIVYGFKNGILPLLKKDKMKTDSGDQQLDISDTPEQRRFNHFLLQIKEEQKNIDMSLFEEHFGYKTPDKILETLHNLKRVDSYNQEAFSIENIILGLEKEVEKMPEGVNRNRGKGILKIVSKILDFNLNDRNQRGV